MSNTSPRGRFVWHELMTTDTAAAKRFYPGITGWSVMPFDANYEMWAAGGAPLGGLMALPDEARAMGQPSAWTPYIAVPDVAATVRQAEALGARTYVGPQDIPGTGSFAVLSDPQGAVFAVFRGDNPAPPEGPPDLSDFSWHELATTDAVAAWSFYEYLFGWVKSEAMDMGPQGTYQMFDRNGMMLGGMYNGGPNVPRPRWLSYVRVPSVDTAALLVKQAGGEIVSGPMDVPGGSRIVQCADPQGALFALHSMPQAAAAPVAKESSPARATAAKKPAAKQPTAKKSAPKKAVAKKAPAKKSAAKKPAPKKAAAKRAAAKKTAAKKPAAKKTAKKRPASRKATGKRGSAKRRSSGKSRRR
jgi:predicted enzyme related to lactoylglutathione lyase